MINQRVSRAVDRLLTDDRLLRRFRKNPEQAMKQFRLKGGELEQVKSGDLLGLLRVGLDPKLAFPRPLSRPLLASMLTRFGAKMAPGLFAAVLLTFAAGTGAFAAGPDARRRVGRAGPGRGVRRRVAARRLNARQHHLRALRRARAVLGARRVEGRAFARMARRRAAIQTRRSALRAIINPVDGGDK